MKAVIMAGGKGERLMPLTATVPKPMMRVLDEPLIYYIVRLLNGYGFDKIAVTLGYMPDTVIRGLNKAFRNKFRFYVEETPLGTAGSVAAAREFLQDGSNEPFLVISGDALTNINLAEMFASHIKSRAAVTMAVQTVPEVSQYGVVVTDHLDRVKEFQEKPAPGTELSNLVNCGIYMINPAVMGMVPPEQRFDFAKDLFPHMLESRSPIHVFRHDGYWCDIGNIAAYHRANMDMLYGVKGLECFTRRKNIVGDMKKRVFVGKNVNIGLNVELSGGVVLGSSVTVTGSTVLNNCVLGRRTMLDSDYISGRVVNPAHSIEVEPQALAERQLPSARTL